MGAVAFQLRDDPIDGLTYRAQAAASFPSRPVALQRDAGQFDIGNSRFSVLHAAQHTEDGLAKYRAPMSKHFDTAGTLSERLAVALRRRISPNTALQRKQVCDAVKCHRHTLDSLIAGATERPDAVLVYRLMQFFQDPAFLNEVFPGVEQLRQRKVARLRAKIRELEVAS